MVGIKEINKLGEEINKISENCKSEVMNLLGSLPETMEIIRSKKTKSELVFIEDYNTHIMIYKEVINKKNQAWGEMVKLIESLAEKEQNKKKRRKKCEQKKK